MLTVLVPLAAIEAGAAASILLLQTRLAEPIWKRSRILAEQNARVLQLIDPDEARLVQLDRHLGWRYQPGYSTARDLISEQGLRSTRLYAGDPVPGVLRVQAFGDSFVYGTEVDNHHAWAHVIETKDAGIEVQNFGVGGYGVDQAYLRFRSEGPPFAPDVVLIGFAAVDLGRLVNVFRPFLSVREYPLSKPRFIHEAAGEVRLLPAPLADSSAYARLLAMPELFSELGRSDAWYEALVYENPLYDVSAAVRLASHAWIRFRRRYLDADRLFAGGVARPTSEAFALQIDVFRRFEQAVSASGAVPIIVFLPIRDDIVAIRRGGVPSYATLRNALELTDSRVIDGAHAFGSTSDPDILFAAGGHYSAIGNAVLADYLAAELIEFWQRACTGGEPERGPAGRTRPCPAPVPQNLGPGRGVSE